MMTEEYIQELLMAEDLPAVIGDLPGSEDNNVCILMSGSYPNTEYMGERTCSTLFNPAIKIVVRNKSYEEGQEWVDQAQNTLHRYHDDKIVSSLLVGSPRYLGRSMQKLHEFQLLFDVQIL